MQIWAGDYGQQLCCCADCFGVAGRCGGQDSLFQIIWKALRSKGFLDSIEQLIQHHLEHPVSPTLWHLLGYLPSKNWLILFFSSSELAEPQPKPVVTHAVTGITSCPALSALHPPCPLFHMLFRPSVSFPPSISNTAQMFVVTVSSYIINFLLPRWLTLIGKERASQILMFTSCAWSTWAFSPRNPSSSTAASRT